MPSAVELQETRDESWNDGKIVATRRFAIWDDSTPLTTSASVRALFGTTVGGVDIPNVRSQFPGDTALYAKSYSLKPENESRYAWMVEFKYENSEPLDKQPQEIGYSQFSVDWSVEFREFYRVNPGIIIPQYGSPSGDAFVSGTSIDVAGEPMTVLHNLSTIEFTETVALATIPDRSQLIRAARGKRNQSPFQGAQIGEVLYRGAKANRIAIDRVSLVHSFSVDSLYHMIQVVDKDADGKPKLIQTGTGEFVAQICRWRQPFPQFANFNLLSENF